MITLPTRFQSYEFTEEEVISALTWTDLQLAYLRNELTDKMQQRLALRLDPLATHEFIQQEAYLTGQMELLEQLILPQTPSNTTT